MRLPNLRFTDLAVPDLRAGDPGVTVWEDAQGRGPAAYGASREGWHWMRLPGIGAFRFGPDAGEASVVPEPGAARPDVVDVYYRAVVPMMLHVRGHEVLHASAVATPAGVVALCARSGTGKSTFAYALSRRGHELLADDAVTLAVRDGSSWTTPLPFAVRLRAASAEHFGLPAKDAVRVVAPPEGAERRELRLAALVLLERRAGAGARGPCPVPPAEAFAQLLPHAYGFDLDDERRRGTMVATYLRCVAVTPVLRLTLTDGLHNVDAAAVALERWLQAAGA